MALPVALAVAGMGLSAYGQYLSGESQEEALERKQALQIERGEEILRRAEFNAEQIQKEGDRARSRQMGQIVGAGISSSSDSALLQMEETAATTAEMVSNTLADARYKAELAFDGADATERAISDQSTRTKLSILGTFISGGMKIGQNLPTSGEVPSPRQSSMGQRPSLLSQQRQAQRRINEPLNVGGR